MSPADDTSHPSSTTRLWGAYWLPDPPRDNGSCPCFIPSDTRTRPTSPGSSAAGARWSLLIGIVRFTAVTLLALRVS